ncbi:MAG TPA: polysialic acid transporter [Bacteroidetes bacterium]|nr:polysialic acid transporter [Bacteroidota bacterium]
MSKKAESGLKVTVYTPKSSLSNPIIMAKALLSDVYSSRELAWRLAVRDISAQYRQAALGIVWAFVLPLVNTFTWVFLSQSGVVTLTETAIPYPVYVFVGTMLWQILVDSINAPLAETTAAKTMLSKLNFPREALIVSGIYKTLFNALIKVVLVITAIAFFAIYPSFSLLLLPIGLISLILVGTAIGLLITPIGVLYTDIGKAIPLFMQFLMYITPVVFAMPSGGLAEIVFKANPFSYLILTIRGWITNTPVEFLDGFILVNILFFIMLLFVLLIYRLAMPILIERMSS